MLALLAAAAALVAGGTALNVALRQAGQAQNLTCDDWCDGISAFAQKDMEREFFFVLPITAGLPPAAFNGRVIGNCAAGTCTVEPQGCNKCKYEYKYKQSGVFGVTHRAFSVRTIPYIAGGIKAWVESVTGGRWGGTYTQTMAQCLTLFTETVCVGGLGQVHSCWKTGGTDAAPVLCRNGRQYDNTANGGGNLTCTPGVGATPWPCEASGNVAAFKNRTFTQAELDTFQ